MTRRERVMTALNHQIPDRIPTDIGGMHNLTTMHRDCYANLKAYLGLKEDATIASTRSQAILPTEELLTRFHSDCYPLFPALPEWEKNPVPQEDGSLTYVDEWGVMWRKSESAIYFDAQGHPMKDITLDNFDSQNWLSPDYDYGYDALAEKAKQMYNDTDYALVVNGPLDGATYCVGQQLLGYEAYFVKLMMEKELMHKMMQKIVDFQIGQWRQIFDKMGDYISVCRMSDDLGSQKAPLMRPKVYREMIKPYQKQVTDYIHSRKPDVKIVYHCDGAIMQFLPDMVEIGMDAWNPVQVTAAGIDDTAAIKAEFGDKIAFWGAGCDSQQVIANEKPDVIRAEVRRRINDLAPNGGMILGSIHNLQKNVPPENIVAFYDAINEYADVFYKNGGKV